MTAKKLNVAVLLDGPLVPAWQHKMLSLLKDSQFANLEIFLVRNFPHPESAQLPEPLRRKSPWIYRALMFFENLRFPRTPDPLTLMNIATDFSAVPTIFVESKAETLSADASAEIVNRQIDVFVRLGLFPIQDEIFLASPLGIWSVNALDSRRGLTPIGFKELYQGSTIGEVAIQAQRGDTPAPKIIFRSTVAIEPTSLNRNWTNLYWKAAWSVPRLIRRAFELGADRIIDGAPTLDSPNVFERAILPGTATLVLLLLRHVARFVVRKTRSLIKPEQWVILWQLGTDQPLDIERFRVLAPSYDRFWADPFSIERSGIHYIFFEDCPRKTNIGQVSMLTIDATGRSSLPTAVLKEPFHMSYPFVFEEGGFVYMVPETSVDKTIRLYRSEKFPLRWTLQSVLIENIRAVDATLVQYNGKWWLFANVSEQAGMSDWDELHLFYSDSPVSNKWTPHPMNPIVTDARTARPAGRIYHRGGSLIRPSQDCSNGYGYAVNFNRIICMTETDYREEVVYKLEPSQGTPYRALHTFNSQSGLVLLDARVERWFWQ